MKDNKLQQICPIFNLMKDNNLQLNLSNIQLNERQ